jgi:hypothetical protein
MVKELFPLTWEAFEDYCLYSMEFSQNEQKILAEALVNPSEEGIMDLCGKHGLGKRESEDFMRKLRALRNDNSVEYFQRLDFDEKENCMGEMDRPAQQ